MGIIQTDKAFVLRPYSTPVLGEDANPGYTFEGWNTKADGSGTTIAGGSAYRPPNDITLYAQWKRKAKNVNVTVYSYNNNYSATFIEPNGAGTYTTTAQDNAFTFTQLGQTGQLTVTSPGIFIQAAEGQTFGGMPGYVSLDGSTSQRTFNFTIGEFTQLYISKIAVEQTLTLDGTYHNKTTQYGSGGTLFGGHKYIVHWYADYRYTQSGTTSTPSSYTFNREDKCFVNVAHKGNAKGHHMYVWLGYKDMQTGTITETVSFNKTGMAQSKSGERKNYYTCEFDEMVFDFRDKPRFNRYLIGYSVTDNGSGCTGIKFEGRYRVYLADDDCEECCIDGEC